jgi:hypothetical protein
VFETPSSKSTFGPFRVNVRRMQTYKDARDAGRLRGLRRLVSGDGLDRADLFDLYAESWSLFYYLLRREPKAFQAYLHELSDRPPAAGKDDGKRELETFQRHFGENLDAVEAEWSRYMTRLIQTNQDEMN